MSKLINEWYNLIRIKSVSGEEYRIADYIAEKLKKMGIEPNYSYYKNDKNRTSPSIWGILKGDHPGKRLMLIGHIDTVGVAEGWDTDPFEPTEDLEDSDKVHGLGAMDMKGGLAAILETAEYYSTRKDEIYGELMLCFVSNEEILSEGTYQLVEEGISADMALMAECRYDNMAIGFRGRLTYEIDVTGQAAHTKDYPGKGNNAIIIASKIAKELENLPVGTHENLGSGSWCVRKIEGGTVGALVVPEKCKIYLDRFTVPNEKEEEIRQDIQKLIDDLGFTDNVKVQLRPRDTPYMESFALEEDNYFVKIVQDAYEHVTGGNLKLDYDLSCCDSNILAVSLGIPTVTFGPSGGGMHSANEYGVKWQVENCAKIYKKIVEDILLK